LPEKHIRHVFSEAEATRKIDDVNNYYAKLPQFGKLRVFKEGIWPSTSFTGTMYQHAMQAPFL
jgi:hypothetical protein